ncbi:MAG: sensor histidine kinase [Planctomycetota bacterium]
MKLAEEGWPILARNIDRIYALTLNMLAYSRPQQLDVELTAMSRLIEEVHELLKLQLERKRIALLVELDEGMPPIPVDPNAMHQALMNLLTNAVEAAPRRRGAITVRTRYLADRNEAQISVSDNGPGIPAPRQEEIFEAFHTPSEQSSVDSAETRLPRPLPRSGGLDEPF